ncbi:oligo-beta-mannoside permease IIC protein [Enterococcus faecium]|nr:oligo-beta-mannoside permease IIC protein [Enterococcus faecium]
MNGFMDKLSEKIMPLANLLGQNRYLTVLRDAFMLSFPLTMFGSIVVVINNLPFFSDATKGTLSNLFGNGQNATMSIMSVFVTFGIGYYLSKSYDVEGIFGGAVSFASFLILTPFAMKTAGGEDVTGVLSLDRLGAKGMFIGMIAAFLAGEIYCRITKRGWQIKMPDGVPPAVTKSFAALIPAVVTLTIFLVINAVMTGIFNANLHDVVYEVIQKTFTVGIGGSGMTLAVVLLMAFVLKKKQYRDVGRLALAPGIFNVNEPAIFGLPIVLNATILIPWVVAPLIVTTFNYLVMAAGLVPAPTGVSVPWTVPIIASGVLATNSWLGGMLQVIDFVIVAFIWYPFLKVLDKQPDLDIA